MPNILNRPMFRRGGSAAEGTGITSGLTNRRAHYDDGATQAGTQQSDLLGNTDQYINPVLNAANVNPSDTVRNQYILNNIPGGLGSTYKGVPAEVLNKTMTDIGTALEPNAKQTAGEFWRAFGSAGADVPAGAKQTWGQAFSKAAKDVNAENFKRNEAIDKYKAEGALSLLKTKNDLMVRRADAIANDPSWHPEITNYNDRYNLALNTEYSSTYNIYKKDISPEAQKRQDISQKQNKEGLDKIQAADETDIENRIMKLKNDPHTSPQVLNYINNLDINKGSNINDISLTNATQGNEGVKNIPQNYKYRFVNGKTYIQNGVIYQYNNGKLTAVLDLHKDDKNFLKPTATKQ